VTRIRDTAPVVSLSVSNADVQAVATSIKKIKEAYDGLGAATTAVSSLGRADRAVSLPVVVNAKMNGSLGASKIIAMAAGDLLSWLKTRVEKATESPRMLPPVLGNSSSISPVRCTRLCSTLWKLSLGP